MHGQHARPTSTLFGSVSKEGTPAPGGPRHSRSRPSGHLRRRLLAYRQVEFVSPRLPGDQGTDEDSLLLVHTRKVVGQVRHRICGRCAEGVITGVEIEERFLDAGLDTRALSHLRARHPGVVWRSAFEDAPGRRDALRRMRIPAATGAEQLCSHLR
ncbi:hypothetical protein ACGFW5_02515 [Streptomyces sp. NPDC048416]|uniref:hypothetical protein n=1 Tax=Streptomyces sp. NPDC048416 TaxID=3365546 RepID=UPI00371C628F